MQLKSNVEFYKPGYIRGYVIDTESQGVRWAVGLYHNNILFGTYYADEYFEDLSFKDTEMNLDRIPRDCAFEFNLNKAFFEKKDRLSIRVINTDHIVCDICLSDHTEWWDVDGRFPLGHVRHANGLTLTGYLNDAVTEHPSYEILAYDGDTVVGRSRMFRWQHIGNPRSPHGQRVGFDLLVDPKLADGVPRKLRVETSTGQPLNGSPVDFLAFPNSMRNAWLDAEGRRKTSASDMALDRILDNSVPLSCYSDIYSGLSSSIISTEELVRFGSDGLIWDIPECDWSLICSAAVTPSRGILQWLPAEALGIAYFDLCACKGDVYFPMLFPAFDLERLLEQGYAAQCFAVPSCEVGKILSLNPRSSFEFFIKVMTDLASDSILHIPHPGGVLKEDLINRSARLHKEVLQDFLATSLNPTHIVELEGVVFPAVQIRRVSKDRAISVIIPTRDEGEMLKKCISSLISNNATYDLDVIVVDNCSKDKKTAAVFLELEAQGVRILEYDDGFNFSQMNNLAVEYARHEQLCFLNNDVFFPEAGVFEELCGRLSDPTVGAVGPLMVRGSDIIQHGGVVLGPHSGAIHAFEDRMRGDPGYGEMLRVAHECSAVTGAMMLTRKSLFQALGGFEEALFAVNFNDVDYCLRLREANYRVIFSPHCYVQHFESVSRGAEIRSPSANRMRREIDNLRLRWRDVIWNDPFSHPLLSTDTMPYRALSSQHRAPSIRSNKIKKNVDLPAWI